MSTDACIPKTENYRPGENLNFFIVMWLRKPRLRHSSLPASVVFLAFEVKSGIRYSGKQVKIV